MKKKISRNSNEYNDKYFLKLLYKHNIEITRYNIVEMSIKIINRKIK